MKQRVALGHNPDTSLRASLGVPISILSNFGCGHRGGNGKSFHNVEQKLHMESARDIHSLLAGKFRKLEVHLAVSLSEGSDLERAGSDRASGRSFEPADTVINQSLQERERERERERKRERERERERE